MTYKRYPDVELVFENTNYLQKFISGLQFYINKAYFTKKYPNSHQDYKEMILISLWSEADKNADGKLDWKEIRRLLEKINYEINETHFMAIFKSHDTDKSNNLDLNEFLGLMTELTTHPAVD
jgi:Ca2+-binding EF-hand superfamily protein